MKVFLVRHETLRFVKAIFFNRKDAEELLRELNRVDTKYVINESRVYHSFADFSVSRVNSGSY